MVEIIEYSSTLRQRFINEKKRLKFFLPSNVMIEHVGSSAVGIGGKNIVDILIGVPSENLKMVILKEAIAMTTEFF